MIDDSRRRFLTHFAGLGFGSTLLPGVLWGQMQQSAAQQITPEMLKAAVALAGLSLDEEEQKNMLDSVNRNLVSYEEVRNLHIPNDVSPPFHFSPLTPGMKVNSTREPLRFSSVNMKRPAKIEDCAYMSVAQLSRLLHTKQITSTELTKMYLERLHRYNEKLNCVVTFLDDVALEQAKRADSEIASGKFRSPLHGIPWGAKDIMAVKGYKTTWGSDAFKDQQIDEESSVVVILREAGAVLLAKLATGELAGGDQWWGGQTKNPWNLEEGSSGSSAGPASATAAGCCAFAIGTETSGSILSPSGRCGVTGLRPTFGRVSRHGVMALSWTQDRLGPLCRSVEDTALVMSVIAKPDGRDMSVSTLPFNWNAHADIKKIRVGILQEAFDEVKDPALKAADAKAIAQVEGLGIRLVPVKMPEWKMDLNSFGVESAAFFDDFLRSGRYKKMTNPSRGGGFRNARAIPAVEYLQSQRARMMMMMELADATKDVDVYLVPANAGGGPPAGRGARDTTPPPPPAGEARRQQTVLGRHFSMANSAGYPAISMPHGFKESGSPTAITFYARPFAEAELLAVAKAWQDASGFHTRHPAFTTTTSL
jgi:Asp-tRNA(Asn)/Glu-tRNA(Gln) amidotransferase A subunit family amidase